jgi:NADH-quinone oxidoreductase subunit H
MELEFKRLGYALLGLFIIFNWGILTGVTMRKLGARVGRRYGVRWFQPWIDLIKNYTLRTKLSHGIMFYLGPVFRLTGGVGLFLFMPLVLSDNWMNYSFQGDLVLILYFQFFGTLGMALGAGEGGHPYSPIGISRGLAQVTAIEAPLALAVLSLAIQYDTLSIREIVEAQQGGILNWTLWTNPFATAGGLLAFLGSFGHSPFNLVVAPNEIPIGPPTEYHSSYLGVMRTNGIILHMIEAVLYMNLFLGGAATWTEFFIKTFLLYLWSAFVGVVFPRFRIEQSVLWFLKIPLLLSIIAIIIYM